MVKVSVIIPALNEEKYIERTLKSVSKQTIPRDDYEIIVSDGKSSDNTVKISRKYADKVISTKNKSIAEGRNKGAKRAKGELLVFVDADTVVNKSLLKKIVKTFKNKNVSGAYVKYIYDFNSIFLYIINIVFLILFKLINLFIPKINTVSGMCIIARKSDFKKIKGFNEDMYTKEDVDLYINLKDVGDFVLIDEEVYPSTRRFKKMGWIGTIKYYFLDTYHYFFNKRFRGHYKKVR